MMSSVSKMTQLVVQTKNKTSWKINRFSKLSMVRTIDKEREYYLSMSLFDVMRFAIIGMN